ncbi:MAG: hypothetical protein AB1726_09540 [Planctomycetota bacterium]
MNRSIVKALFLDALYQVLDNAVFRILAALTAVPVLFTVLVQFRAEEVALLFGWKTETYAGLLSSFSHTAPLGTDLRLYLIENFVFIILFLTVWAGIPFCIIATAFFVPRMIEKGAADVLFHKPVSRLQLYLSRYLAGIFFAAGLSAVLVVGMYVGLLFVSGHHDPGILWACPTMTYMFALVYGVSMLIGVATRSTVASILLTTLFFLGNSCVQLIWVQGVNNAPIVEESVEEELEHTGISRVLTVTIDTLHYALPKTGDASRIAAKLRRSFARQPFRDRATGLLIADLPAGLEVAEEEDAAGPAWPAAIGEALGDLRFAAAGPDGELLRLWEREARAIPRRRPNGEGQNRPEQLREAEDFLAERVEPAVGEDRLETFALPKDRPAGAAEEEATFFRSHAGFAWTEEGAAGSQAIRIVVFLHRNRVFTLEYRARAGEEPGERFRAACGGFDASNEPEYDRRFAIDAPLEFNILFSIGSSVAFAALVLLLGWWRLGRIDF